MINLKMLVSFYFVLLFSLTIFVSFSIAAFDASFIQENSGDRAGYSVSSAGDVNGDGYDDVLIGASWNDDGGSGAGKAYLILGKASSWQNGVSLSTSDASFIGENSGDWAGYSVSSAGDVNGDGYDDILISAYGNDDGGSGAGKTYLILGKASGWQNGVSLSTSDASFIGENSSDWSGYSVSSAGDVNGDGYDDILISAYSNDDGGSDAGKTYLILGKASGWQNGVSLSTSDASFIGENSGDWAGYSVSSAGDVNGDSYNDILIGAYSNDDGGSAAGKTYLILGKTSGWQNGAPLSTSDASFIGENSYDYSGSSVSSAGDVNGDSYDDILIGAYGYDDGGSLAGKTYLLFGKTSGWQNGVSLAVSDASFIGEDSWGSLGDSVSSAGDVNGDGYDDILIGASSYGSLVGKAYLILGRGLGWQSNVSLPADVYDSYNGENAEDYFGVALSSAGDVNGDGNDDIIIGSDAGKTYLVFGIIDNDKDNMPNDWEIQYGLDPDSPADRDLDNDNDGLTNYEEYDIGLNPIDSDVDDDGMPDGWETQYGLDPWDPADAAIDSDSDGLSNIDEYLQGTDPIRYGYVASFIGENSSEYSGESVSSAGDVNGDGYDDILISAFGNDDGGPDAGKVYLILGKASSWQYGVSLDDADASFIGENAGDKAAAVSSAGDVNGDGYDDILIGAYGNDDSGSDAGKTYLIFGKASGWLKDVSLSTSDASFIGENSYDYSGKSVSSAGDVNGDGYDDILIGAYGYDGGGLYWGRAGKTYLILGKTSGWQNSVSLSLSDASFIAVGSNDNAGFSVSSAGDVNGDGYDDILIGAPFANDLNYGQGGRTFLIFGKVSGWQNNVSLISSDASFIGHFNEFSGSTVSSAGDVNGDGFDDILIGVDEDAEVFIVTRWTHLILGKDSGWQNGVEILDVEIAHFTGETFYVNDLIATTVSSAGDINRDGYDDILIGGSSRVSLVFGKASGWQDIDLQDDADISIPLGHSSVALAGDVNGDGYYDILIGNGNAESNAGNTYLIIGSTDDTDLDGMTDIWENQYGLDPTDGADADDDNDSDGLTNLEEFQLGTNPLNPDTDGDGIDDGSETCPLDPPVLIGSTFYPSLQDAYDNAIDGAVIQSQSENLTGDININRNITVTLETGYDCSFSDFNGQTRIEGQLTVSNGVLVITEGILLIDVID